MRLIDADAFEADFNEELLPMLIERYGRDEALGGLHFSFCDCICNIQAQPTIQPETQWIPCSKRLPEHELVLVQFSDGDFSLLQFPTVYRRKDMVAWMPLPEPYKEDTDD